jgi:hypothetical protein
MIIMDNAFVDDSIETGEGKVESPGRGSLSSGFSLKTPSIIETLPLFYVLNKCDSCAITSQYVISYLFRTNYS